MITREEARVTVSMVPTHQYALGYNDAVETLFDQFEQYIKSLEAQLANTEQLTCETCKWRNCLASEKEPCNSCLIKLGYGNNYELKDTK